MPRKLNIKPHKTYANEANVERAVAKHNFPDDVSYLIVYTAEGRAYPLFTGERALMAGVHFYFCVV